VQLVNERVVAKNPNAMNFQFMVLRVRVGFMQIEGCLANCCG
jgi:hypothetical protein